MRYVCVNNVLASALARCFSAAGHNQCSHFFSLATQHFILFLFSTACKIERLMYVYNVRVALCECTHKWSHARLSHVCVDKVVREG